MPRERARSAATCMSTEPSEERGEGRGEGVHARTASPAVSGKATRTDCARRAWKGRRRIPAALTAASPAARSLPCLLGDPVGDEARCALVSAGSEISSIPSSAGAAEARAKPTPGERDGVRAPAAVAAAAASSGDGGVARWAVGEMLASLSPERACGVAGEDSRGRRNGGSDAGGSAGGVGESGVGVETSPLLAATVETGCVRSGRGRVGWGGEGRGEAGSGKCTRVFSAGSRSGSRPASEADTGTTWSGPPQKAPPPLHSDVAPTVESLAGAPTLSPSAREVAASRAARRAGVRGRGRMVRRARCRTKTTGAHAHAATMPPSAMRPKGPARAAVGMMSTSRSVEASTRPGTLRPPPGPT
mmetsp:Transcript_16507/g.50715  ORF Transcript_16507/g.50715 Transcript_16507/m.50715 type:complete len:360 (-) Transcript_16507:1282-2361(-)